MERLLIFLLALALLALHAPSLVTAGTISRENMALLRIFRAAEVMDSPDAPGKTSLASADIAVDAIPSIDIAVDSTDIAVDDTSDPSTDPADGNQTPFSDAYIAFYDFVYSTTISRVTRDAVQRLVSDLESLSIPTHYSHHPTLQEQERLTRVIYQTFRRYLPVCDVTAFDPFFTANDFKLQNHLRYAYDEGTREFSLTLELHANRDVIMTGVMDRPDNTCKLYEAIDTVLSDFFLFEGARPQSHAQVYAAIDRNRMVELFVTLVKVIYDSEGVYNPFGTKWERLLQKQIKAVTLIELAANDRDYTRGLHLYSAIVRVFRWIRAGPHLMTYNL